MKFETNLSRQDKRTISIVLYLAIVALFAWYMIRPAWVKLGTLDDQIATAQAQKDLNRTKIMNLVSAESLYDKAVNDITESTSYFYDVMDNSEIEKLVTEYILDYGLTPVDFSIDLRDGVTYVSESPYAYSDVQAPSSRSTPTPTPTPEATPTGRAGSNSSTPAVASVADVQSLLTTYSNAVSNCNSTTYSEVQCAKISIVILGNSTLEQSLIDDITKNPSVRVTGFSWSDATPVTVTNEDGTTTVVNLGDKQLTLDLNFYMSDKPDFETEDQAAEEG